MIGALRVNNVTIIDPIITIDIVGINMDTEIISGKISGKFAFV